ncbi:TlyA family RNA methyltransferase [Alkalibacter rhizosphaerae]|uniref:TlyA family RNA methyltransferase n=1 Tax=Alkalibacter rhizosphaerae TaxID=2815577 RepID=A0A975AIR1_9FIRM|nr:TlyA family RNA methyltransferase [Alkalibacter rhizosphaerae]QSX08934.1 TlyA family RNA methyltransferase [Alkalibacter rhizosphaerae]
MSRLDVYLHENGFFDSRESAKRNIMAGNVTVNGQIVDKAGTKVKDDDQIDVREKDCPYVSRGGLKLKKAMDRFGIDLKDKVAMDAGASTGGFTDCMLQNGAAKVYAIDVGYGQLDWKLRSDPRVISMERTNFRYLTYEEIGEKVDFFVMDVSFISVTKLIPSMLLFLKAGALAVVLIKPQFEAGKDKVGKHGIVKSEEVHREVLETTLKAFVENGLKPIGLDFSPIKGAKGNIEYLVLLENSSPEDEEWSAEIDLVVKNAQSTL